MITAPETWQVRHPDFHGVQFTGPKARCESYRDADFLCRVPESYIIEPAEACQCCGVGRWFRDTQLWTFSHGQIRCGKHVGRDPCAIEGCTRTTAAGDGYSTERWLCNEHWRRFVPPRSRERRTYQALFRKGKRLDWPDDMRRRFWRYWDFLLRRARRQATEGRLDMDEINRIMGWD